MPLVMHCLVNYFDCQSMSMSNCWLSGYCHEQFSSPAITDADGHPNKFPKVMAACFG